MNHDKLSIGDAPNEFNVVIEIPANSGPVKYEIDKASGALIVDRFMATPMYYPVNYGYIPHTLSEDDDPVDVLVLTPAPLINGAVIKCRPLGVFCMEDESGMDMKVFAVPVDQLSAVYHHMKTIEDVPPYLLAQINHFFEHYKDLEAGKWVKVQGWEGLERAQREITNSIARFEGSEKVADAS